MFDKDNVRKTISVLRGKVLEDFGFTLTDAEMLLRMERAQIERRNEYIARQLKCIPSEGLKFLIDEARKPQEEANKVLAAIHAKESKQEEAKPKVNTKATYARKKKL